MADGRLMPDADMTNTMVIGAVSSHSRTTKSWVLGRLLRDEDDRVDGEMKQEQNHVPPNATAELHKGHPPAYQDPNATAAPAPEWEALRVTVYEVDDNPPVPHGVPTLDTVWFSGIAVILIQLVVSAVPWIVSRDWGIFLVTVVGTVLALLNGSLPQWREEKWSCTKKGGATVTITQGNGSRHAIAILGKKGVGLDLEILAIGTRTASPSMFTRDASAVLALFWIVLLVVVAGLNENSWCKGICLHNVKYKLTQSKIFFALVSSGVSRTSTRLAPAVNRVHLEFILSISRRSAINGLQPFSKDLSRLTLQ